MKGGSSTAQIAQVRGLQYLVAEQLPAGGFASESSPSLTPWQPSYTYRTTFVPSLILACLASNSSPVSITIRNQLASFLLEQSHNNWAFNYWALDEPVRQDMPYPDDLDDTFCAVIALHAHDEQLITPACLAAIVKLLVATEQKPGGPYRTWLVQPEHNPVWQDIDPAVNANIAYFLATISNPLPSLEKLLAIEVKKTQPQSPYYPGAYPLWYYYTRAIHSPTTQQQLLERLVKQHATEPPTQPLQTALLLTSLMRLGYRGYLTEQLQKHILHTQQPNGSWAAAAFCIDPARNGTTHYHGSASLTTAFCLEALALAQPPSKATTHQNTSHTSEQTRALSEHIHTTFRAECEQLSVFLKKPLLQLYSRLENGEATSDISLLAYFFAQTLQPQNKPRYDEQFYGHLGLANMHGWIAYTIYDDFLDDEGRTPELPVANVALRKSLQHFRSVLSNNQPFQKLVEQTFTVIDSANAWEATYCRATIRGARISINRLPNFGSRRKLAERSLGHGLTPRAVLTAGGLPVNHNTQEHFDTAFQHYLIIRQLNDDAHDWQEDFSRGHLTFVVTHILQDLQIRPGTYNQRILQKRMERQFWHHTLPAICKIMQRHLQQARRILQQDPLLTNNTFLQKLLNGQEAIITETLSQQKSSALFLQNYRDRKTKS